VKQLVLIILFLFASLISYGQESDPRDFYLHIVKVIEANKDDIIQVNAEKYGCVGSSIKWNALISSKPSNFYKIDFYSEKLRDTRDISSGYQNVLDTSFVVTKTYLLTLLKQEEKDLRTRPVLIEASYKFIIKQEDTKKEFLIRKGEGLYYLLRFNKSWISYFSKK